MCASGTNLQSRYLWVLGATTDANLRCTLGFLSSFVFVYDWLLNLSSWNKLAVHSNFALNCVLVIYSHFERSLEIDAGISALHPLPLTLGNF